MKILKTILLSVLPILSTAQLTKLDNVSTKLYMGENDTMKIYCSHCAGYRWQAALADNAIKQLGKYGGYDRGSYKLTKWGEQVKGDGCCIDVLLRAWQELRFGYGWNISDTHLAT